MRGEFHGWLEHCEPLLFAQSSQSRALGIKVRRSAQLLAGVVDTDFIDVPKDLGGQGMNSLALPKRLTVEGPSLALSGIRFAV